MYNDYPSIWYLNPRLFSAYRDIICTFVTFYVQVTKKGTAITLDNGGAYGTLPRGPELVQQKEGIPHGSLVQNYPKWAICMSSQAKFHCFQSRKHATS